MRQYQEIFETEISKEVQEVTGIVLNVEDEVQELRQELTGRTQEIDETFNEELFKIRDGLEQMDLVTRTLRTRNPQPQKKSSCRRHQVPL